MRRIAVPIGGGNGGNGATWATLMDVDFAGGTGAISEFGTFSAGGLTWRVTNEAGAATVTRTADALLFERNTANAVASVTVLLADTPLGRDVTARDVFSIALYGGMDASGDCRLLAFVGDRADANATRLGRGMAGGIRNHFGLSASVATYTALGVETQGIPWQQFTAGSSVDPFVSRAALSFQHGAACVAVAGSSDPGRVLTATQRGLTDASTGYPATSAQKVGANAIGVRARCTTGAVLRLRRLVVEHLVLPE